MATTKLGPHCINPTVAALTWARTAPIVKSLDNLRALEVARPDAIRIFRHFFPSQPLEAHGADVAEEVLHALGTAPASHIELYNEGPATLKDGLARYCELVGEAVAHVKEVRPDLVVVGFSFATGNVELDGWAYLRSQKFGGCSMVGLHAYWGNQQFTEWQALRYRTLWKVGDPVLLLTEVGRDKIEGGKGGWKADRLSAEQYAAELVAFDLEIGRDAGVLGATPFSSGAGKDWSSYDLDPVSPLLIQGGSVPKPPPPELYFSPNHGGPRASTTGVVIHATLGGSGSPASEYAATLNWFANPTSQVSSHAVVGPSDQVAYPVDPALDAWHCRASNATHLGIELAKAHLGDVILPEILDAAARIVAGWCKQYAIPIVWSTTAGLAEHHEMPTNTDHHADVGGPFDRADFLARVVRYSSQEAELTDEQKAKVLDHLGVIWGESKAATIKANPAESERAIHERIAALKDVLGLNQ